MLAVASHIPNAIILNLKYQTTGVPTAKTPVVAINVYTVTKVIRSAKKAVSRKASATDLQQTKVGHQRNRLNCEGQGWS